MSNAQLLTTIHNQDGEIRRLHEQLQSRGPLNYEQKYKKALRSIEEIIRANKQIKDELDHLRSMRQVDLDSFSNVQKDEFKKAYENLLKEKNNYVLAMQALELENEKLKYTVSELENQVALYKNQKFPRPDDRENLRPITPQQQSPQHQHQLPHRSESGPGSPRKLDKEGKDFNQTIRDKEAEFHRTIANYEEHHSNLTRTNKRLEERIAQLDNKLAVTEKNWRIKYESKEFQVIDVKALTRQQFSQQISLMRKQNTALKLSNSDLYLKIQSLQKNAQSGNRGNVNYDWQAELVREMIAVKANLQPLRQQIGELQQMNFYEKEQSVRERTNLQTHVLQLQAQVERQNESIHNLERKLMEAHQERSVLDERALNLKRLEEENRLLNGRVIVMESREIALKNRTGEELEERILEFEGRIQLLLSNKEGLKQLREVGIHQLLALKAYILQLDGKLKELLNSNNHLLRKYKSYKERYQASLKEEKTYGMTINTLKMKILGYDKLVLKLQGELQRVVKINEQEVMQASRRSETDSKGEIFRKKYELVKEKLEIQQKYKEQEMETLKLNYEARIMEFTIKAEEIKSLKEMVDLYRGKNDELQSLLAKRETELEDSKVLGQAKQVNAEYLDRSMTNNRQTKDIINNLHLTIKGNDEVIFKLQSELRTKDDNYRRNVTRLERDLQDAKEEHERVTAKREIDYKLTIDQEAKRYKNRIGELEQNLQLLQISHKDQHSKYSDDIDSRLRRLETRAQQAEAERDQQIFNRRRLEKQILDLTNDKDELQRGNSELQMRTSQLRSLQRENEELKLKLSASSKQSMRDSYIDYELQGKDNIIRKLNGEILQLKSTLGSVGEKDITLTSQRSEISYLKKEIDDLHEAISRYNNEIVYLKSNLDNNKTSFVSGMENVVGEKEDFIGRLRRDLANKDARIHELEEQTSQLQESIRKLKRDLTQMELLREEFQQLQSTLADKSVLIDKLRGENRGYDEEVERYKSELSFVKESFQKQSYELLQREDQISKYKLEINTVVIRHKEQLQSRVSDEVESKERQISRLNAELQTLKNNLAVVEEDRNYQEETNRRVSNDLNTLRVQFSSVQEEGNGLRDQLYAKSQEMSKLQLNLQNYRLQVEQYAQKEEEVFKMRNQLYSLRNEISVLQDEHYAKDGATARVTNELHYLKERYSELEEELRGQLDNNNRLSYEISALRSGGEDHESTLMERDSIISKLMGDVSSVKNKYRDLQEEMQERENAFGLLTQELNKMKGTLGYYEDDLEDKNSQIVRLGNEKEQLRGQIERQVQEITLKSQELNRAKQEVFAIRMQASEREYQDKIRLDQEIYSFKSRIAQLQQEVEDKEAEVRRARIELDTSRYREPVGPVVDEQELDELRMDLSKKQRELVNLRFELEDKQYQLDGANNSMGLLKTTLSEYQQQQEVDREQYDSAMRERNLRERNLQDEIARLGEQLQLKPKYIEAPKSYSITYSEEEMGAVNEQLNMKQRELNSIRYELEDKVYLIENLQAKVKVQENLMRQLQLQAEEDVTRMESEIQEYIQRERQHQQQYQEIEFKLEQQAFQQQRLQTQVQEEPLPATEGESHLQYPPFQQYLQEIDRLNHVVEQLQEEINTFKLKLSSMINQQHRIEQNLVTMVLLFSEVESLRDRIKGKEDEINEVRKSFIQMTVAGEMEAARMSRLIALGKEDIHSQERISIEMNQQSVEREIRHQFEQFEEIRSQRHIGVEHGREEVVLHTEYGQKPQLIMQEQREAEYSEAEPEVERQEAQLEEVAQSQTQSQQQAEPQVQEKREVVEEVSKTSQQVKDSLIMELQKEKTTLIDSQTGKIRIKIQNTVQNPVQHVGFPFNPQNPPHPAYVRMVNVQNQPALIPMQPYPQMQGQPQYIQYSHPQPQLIPQGHYLQQQFSQYAQLGHHPAMQPQPMMRQMNPPPFNPQAGQFRPH